MGNVIIKRLYKGEQVGYPSSALIETSFQLENMLDFAAVSGDATGNLWSAIVHLGDADAKLCSRYIRNNFNVTFCIGDKP